ncbi:hypothetical protein HNQ07_002027 [Deinococcus metalli]|uniref:DUF1453 domain-containing protein n=1 Tax=Deinococcus metalli TaxID=1141878 RepID=A0A7W8NR67_9DEIO|nr:DUF1453 domain-containing protein [Deinococcus metalli]MBB5376563.1 hypothetical protein [Deinococcus metalli]GHF43109.1 hypothetical protein GCM10017781_19390 [Deinococcus metalli]
MTLTDTLISFALIALVVRQLRGRPLTLTGVLWPVPLVLFAAATTLHVPSGGPALDFTLLGGAVGVMLGALCGVLTQVSPTSDGRVVARASGPAALLWVLGIGSRVGFGLYATHGGGPAIARFSETHHLTMDAWAGSLLLMSLLEVMGRAAVLLWKRAHVARPSAGVLTPSS